MLVLTRRKNQRVEIMGGLVVVEVLKIDGDQVRLGFVAPPEIDIDRSEIAASKRETDRLTELSGSSAEEMGINHAWHGDGRYPETCQACRRYVEADR